MKKSNKIFLIGITMLFVSVLILFALFKILNKPNDNENLFPKSKGNETFSSNSKPINRSHTYSSGLYAVIADGPFDITILPGTTNQISVQTDENTFRHLNFSSSRDVLNIGIHSGFSLSPKTKIKLTIISSTIQNVILSGNNHLEVNKINSEYLKLKMRGNNVAHLQGKIKNLHLVLAGKSELNIDVNQADTVNLQTVGETLAKLSGSVNQFTILGLGNTKVFAKDLIANDVHIESGSEADMVIHADKNLSIATLGKSRISYYGNPKIDKSQLGSIIIKKM